MAKIVFLGNFRVDYSSETHHAKTLESMGHKVIKMQETEARSEDILRASIDANLFIWIHTHGWNTPGKFEMDRVLRTLKEYGVPTMTYHLDLWFGLKRQKDLNSHPVYRHIEHFFTVDKKMADWFNKKTNVQGHYLPAGVFDQECILKQVEKTNDLIFVGSRVYHSEWPYRTELIEWLSNNYGEKFKQYGSGGIKSIRGIQLNKLYWSTKIVIGDTLCIGFDYPNYWSDRVYETLGRGGFIIHPYIKGMEKEFEDQKHLVFYEYRNFKQLRGLIDYYLEHDDEREKIRKAGHELVKNNYTYKNRWQYILKELGI